MMKSFTCALLASALFVSAASAAEMSANPATCANFSGVYAGALMGYGSGKARTTLITTTNQNMVVPVSFTSITDLSISGVNGGVVLGYGKALGTSKIYLGLDLAFVVDGSKGKMAQDGDELEIRRKDSLEAGARLGLIVANAMPFLRLGWSNSKLESKPQNFLNKRSNGFVAGVGVDMKLTSHIVAGLEYNYASFSKVGKVIPINDAIPLDSNNQVDAKTKLTHNAARIKVAYQF